MRFSLIFQPLKKLLADTNKLNLRNFPYDSTVKILSTTIMK